MQWQDAGASLRWMHQCAAPAAEGNTARSSIVPAASSWAACSTLLGMLRVTSKLVGMLSTALAPAGLAAGCSTCQRTVQCLHAAGAKTQ